ncbi:LysR substrate-binding domain-containing protein [Pseudomonas putida]|uniref:LysR family transcriptional regulator n=1 Tax=Pseudomonas putida TaxID=303 RepID=A0A6I6XES3_PSEPU|nr:LysR substrate-binding domain-containing protein [Pseudomonas putida]QHG64134.2 LysR family transcriptional regulator [Pseudomonas putida]
MRLLDLALLHSFKTIAESKNLSVASQRLHKTQAAVSIQLKKLEDLVGERLVERGHQSTVLTAHGERMLEYARRMLALSDEAMVHFTKGEVCGTVRFGIPDDYASAFLPPVIQQFTQRYPKVSLKIRNDISQNLFTALEAGELDLALVTQRAADGNGEVLRCDQLHWVGAAGFQLDRSAPLPLALYPHGCGYRRHILSALSASLIDYEVAFECTGVTGVQLAVESGLAIAATSTPLIRPGWQILETGDAALPALGNVIIELRQSLVEPSAAVRFFADELRRQVVAR